MDVLQAMEDKAFWGHEFLTWLLYLGEESGGEINLNDMGPTVLWIEDFLVLGSMDTESKENIIKNGDVGRSAEAATALSIGKKVLEAKFGMIRDDREWSFKLKGDTLDLLGVKIPKVLTEEGDDWQATALIRRGHIAELVDALDALFAEFARTRITNEWTAEVMPAMSKWINEKEGS